MKLLNVNEEVPKIFYVFVGQGKFIFSKANYQNYLLTKGLVSGGFKNLIERPDMMSDFNMGNIDYVPFKPNKPTFQSPTSHLMDVINTYQMEYILEYHRPKIYPSRLSCIYAFGNYESCITASKEYGWPLENVRKFKLKKFNNEFDKCVKIVKCNMEIASRMWHCDISTFDRESITNMANSYWKGNGIFATERIDIESNSLIQRVGYELYEYLIEGVLEEIEE